MHVNRDEFRAYLSKASFSENGDSVEREHFQLAASFFPLCEEFWKQFVVPLTARINDYPERFTQGIDFRPSTHDLVQDIASYHYSMFLNLVHAYQHIHLNAISPLEDVYVHLAAACDLAETVLVKWYILAQGCRGRPVEALQGLSREGFLELASRWYDDNYSHLYDIYGARGKPPPIWLPARNDILLELFADVPELYRAYRRSSQPIREYRNVIVHDLKIARLLAAEDQYWVPKSSRIQSYRTWRDVAAVAGDQRRITQDFALISTQSTDDLAELGSTLNALWQHLLGDFTDEFYSSERDALRRRFDITFSSGPTIVRGNESPSSPIGGYPSASGTYSGGTADYGPRYDLASHRYSGNLATRRSGRSLRAVPCTK